MCLCKRWGRVERHRRLHPEKPWLGAEGRGFDSRHLHSNKRRPCPEGRRPSGQGRLFVLRCLRALTRRFRVPDIPMTERSSLDPLSAPRAVGRPVRRCFGRLPIPRSTAVLHVRRRTPTSPTRTPPGGSSRVVGCEGTKNGGDRRTAGGGRHRARSTWVYGVRPVWVRSFAGCPAGRGRGRCRTAPPAHVGVTPWWPPRATRSCGL